ncbi:8-oxo-dGTP diphosphatase [Clostridium cavendishii DSM 21758]|uniref:8-oxo-dGTP diphosphatase n=1 Tax=Clostridium cavendishii DSM 21758 TaxID=1121302 RepID=A0A1M6MFM2_9CLOT|nr:NUDIX domain-containing protein [Clostridium cavendishii]SHJ82261.1 8-oxo-dGTP diphosphatase [Clostridium cavendishii DSM 21758]
MLKLKSYDLKNIKDCDLKFAVIATQYKGKWLFVRNKERETWEMPGGHRESFEDINTTASRELWEETGAKEYELYPICIYSIDDNGIESLGKLFYANVSRLSELPDFETCEIKLFDSIPLNPTYPLIQNFLIDKTIEFLKSRKDIKG